MSDLLGFGSRSGDKNRQEAEVVMGKVRQEMQQANVQTLMNNLNETCFKACITKPGTSLSGAETTCLDRCFDRFLEAYNVTSRMYVKRLTEERLKDQPTP